MNFTNFIIGFIGFCIGSLVTYIKIETDISLKSYVQGFERGYYLALEDVKRGKNTLKKD